MHLRGMSIADPECVKWVLHTNFKNYLKGPQMVHLLGPLFGEGIFVVNGDSWKHQRCKRDCPSSAGNENG